MALLVLAVLAAVMTPAAAHEPHPALQPSAAGWPGLAVLRDWDAARARAWAYGDVVALRRLYPPGSAVGGADVGLLRRYLARGLVVTGMRRQLLAERVVRADGTRVVLRVTDRLVGARAVSTDSSTTLPASAPRAWGLALRLGEGRWWMASVRPTDPP